MGSLPREPPRSSPDDGQTTRDSSPCHGRTTGSYPLALQKREGCVTRAVNYAIRRSADQSLLYPRSYLPAPPASRVTTGLAPGRAAPAAATLERDPGRAEEVHGNPPPKAVSIPGRDDPGTA